MSGSRMGGVAEIYLGLLLLTGHNQKLGGRVDNLELANDSSGIVGHKELLQMVDDNLVAACL